jgi:hypothetical protein
VGTTPSTQLLVVGVLVQIVVGLVCLALVRVTFSATERVVRSFTRPRIVRSVRRATDAVVESVLFVRSLCPMGDSAAGRAPPFSSVSR